jgi:hypothetical protein
VRNDPALTASYRTYVACRMVRAQDVIERGPPGCKTKTHQLTTTSREQRSGGRSRTSSPGSLLFRRYVTSRTPYDLESPCRRRVKPHNTLGNRTDIIIRVAIPPRAQKISRRQLTSCGLEKSCVCRFSTTSSSRATSTAITRCSSEGRSRASRNEGGRVRCSTSAAHRPPSIMSEPVIERPPTRRGFGATCAHRRPSRVSPPRTSPRTGPLVRAPRSRARNQPLKLSPSVPLDRAAGRRRLAAALLAFFADWAPDVGQRFS